LWPKADSPLSGLDRAKADNRQRLVRDRPASFTYRDCRVVKLAMCDAMATGAEAPLILEPRFMNLDYIGHMVLL